MKPKSINSDDKYVFHRILAKIMKHTKWDIIKATIWMDSENPFLGGVSPINMILRGRAHKVEKFVDGCISESTPPTKVKRVRKTNKN